MSPIQVPTWLKQNMEHVLERCVTAVRNLNLSILTPEVADPQTSEVHLREEILSLCQLILGMETEHLPTRQADLLRSTLTAWVERYRQEKQASLVDLLKILSAIRATVRETVLQAVASSVEPAVDTQQAVAAWQTMSPIFDQMMEMVSEIYTGATEQALTERLQESEYLTSSLVQATEEADKALILLRSIYEISQALGTSLSDAGETFDKLAQKLGTALKAQHCIVWLSDVGQPHAAAMYVEDQAPEPTLPETVDESAFGTVLQSGRPSVLATSPNISPPDRELLDSLHTDILLLAPFAVQGIPIGVVSLGRRAGDSKFDSIEVTLVGSVITQAAVAVQNAELYQEIRDLNRSLEARVASRTRDLAREKERIETLYAIGQELSTSLDLDQVLEETLQLITRAVGAADGSILMLDQESNTLTCVARSCLTSGASLRTEHPAERHARWSASTEAGVPGWVIQHREAVLISDVLEDHRWEPVDRPDGSLQDTASDVLLDPRGMPKIRSLIAAPLAAGDNTYGVLLISDEKPGALDQDQQRLVVASAQQITQAMSNAHLYRREQKDRSQTQAVLQSIADGVIVNDTKDQVIVFNTAAEEIVGTQRDAVLGRSVWRLFDAFEGDGRSDALAALTAISSSPLASVGQSIEMTLEIPDVEVPGRVKIISAHMSPVVAEDQESLGVVTALRDITREVEADRAKSDFVSTVSHELRTPLTSIKGYTDLIHGEAVGPINDHQKRFLGIIKNNADRLTALINDLLDISRIESGRVKLKRETINLVEVIREMAESLREQVEGKGLKLEMDIPDDSPEVVGDRLRLAQIVTNLISNAYKFTDEGWVRVTLRPLETTLRLDVADSGIGISTEDQGEIFERFYRADTPVMEGRGGTGLGLAITKELVELHGGRLWVKSELGVGSTFTVILPSAAQDLPADLLAELPAGAKKILVVDDERDILALLRHQLTTQGYQVITASTGGTAITKAIKEQPDLITLDILLPDRHGFDVLRELKARPETAQIPVIVLSVAQDETSGYKLGAVDYIVKPLDEQRLLSSVSNILHPVGELGDRKGTILIAEDTEDTAELLIELLTRNGYTVLHASNGYETLATARRECPDMILLDLRMPGMDGYEALTHLKKDPETRGIPILVMSAHAADPVQERLRLQSMGAEDFLSKPFSLEKLLKEIQRVAFVQSDHTVAGEGESGEPMERRL